MEKREYRGRDINGDGTCDVGRDLYWFDIRLGRRPSTETILQSILEIQPWTELPKQFKAQYQWLSALHCWIRNVDDFMSLRDRFHGKAGAGILLRGDSGFYTKAKKRAFELGRTNKRGRRAVIAAREYLVNNGWLVCVRSGTKPRAFAGSGTSAPGVLPAYLPTPAFEKIVLTSRAKGISALHQQSPTDENDLEGSEVILDEVTLSARSTSNGTNKANIPVDDKHPIIIETKALLKDFNQMNIAHNWLYQDKASIDLGSVVKGQNAVIIDPKFLIYARVFSRGDDPNHNYMFNGRFYCPVNSKIPSPKRDLIAVDNENTVEVDFKFLHLRFAYDLAGISIDFEDAYNLGPEYSLAGFDRTIIKMITLMLINLNGFKARNKLRGRKSKKSLREISSEITRCLNGYHESGRWFPGELSTKCISRQFHLVQHLESFGLSNEAEIEKKKCIPSKVSHDDVHRCVEKIIEKHDKISSYLCSDFGIKAQNLDSRIMMLVMREAISLNMPMLILHDAVRVKESQLGVAIGILKAAYQQVIGSEISGSGFKVSYSILSKKQGALVG
jgi:hypothetical protein